MLCYVIINSVLLNLLLYKNAGSHSCFRFVFFFTHTYSFATACVAMSCPHPMPLLSIRTVLFYSYIVSLKYTLWCSFCLILGFSPSILYIFPPQLVVIVVTLPNPTSFQLSIVLLCYDYFALNTVFFYQAYSKMLPQSVLRWFS